MVKSATLTHYLGRSWIFLLGIFAKLDRLSSAVKPEEPISRFIVEKRYFKRETGEVLPSAFTPSPKTNTTSVYRVEGCTDRKIWRIASHFVEALRTDRKKVIARADLAAFVILAQNLGIRPALQPHPRHANIVDWPDRSASKLKASELARAATLHLRA
jgi:hypothetical protein